LTFLLDENIPDKVAKALAALDFPVTHALDYFARGTGDEQLFVELRDRQWILVTHDAKMWKKKAQREALLQAGIGVFVLVSSAAYSPADLATLLIRRLPEMIQLAASSTRPFVFRVPDRGRIERFR
jgi:predicted nuclease of predicted toxin-antitoxin system